MPSCRLWTHTTWVAFVVLAVFGCQSPERIEPPQYRDDFGRDVSDEPITESSVSEEQMLHRRAQIEIRAIGAVPVDESDLEAGAGAGVKASIEVQKNIYLGLAFDWARFDIDADDLSSPSGLANAGPLQRYEYIDRYNILFTFDHDIVLSRNFIREDSPLMFRWGFGPGVFIAAGPEEEALAGDLVTFVQFLLRGEVGLRWQLAPWAIVSLGGAFDFVPEDNIEVNFGNDVRAVEGKVNFSTFNVVGGLTFQF